MDYIPRERFNLLSNGKIKPNDILFCLRGSLGKFASVGGMSEGAIASSLVIVRPGCSIDPKFLMLYFESDMCEKAIKALGNGAAQPNLSAQSLKSFSVPIPSLAEQRRIVGILDEAFAGMEAVRANAERNLANARSLFESALSEIFALRGQRIRELHLSEVATEFGRGKSKHRPRNDPVLYGGDYPFIQTGDVRNSNHLISNYSQTYNQTGLAQSKLWPKGTICITIAANIAETGVLGFDACFPDSVIGIVPNEKVATEKYIEYMLQSFRTRLQARGKGSAQANINLGTFENMRFPFPNLATQRRISERLDTLNEAVDSLSENYDRKLASLDELRKSLLHQAFSGNL